MDSNSGDKPTYDDSIDRLIHSAVDKQELKVLQYAAGLKAMLDVLPEDTTPYSNETIDNYLWVVEMLLQTIYDNLYQKSDKEV